MDRYMQLGYYCYYKNMAIGGSVWQLILDSPSKISFETVCLSMLFSFKTKLNVSPPTALQKLQQDLHVWEGAQHIKTFHCKLLPIKYVTFCLQYFTGAGCCYLKPFCHIANYITSIFIIRKKYMLK